MQSMSCECEHAAHLDKTHTILTPNTDPGHRYGMAFYPHCMVTVQTPYGKFRVCQSCAADCYQGFPVVA
jgi:hypothetical protein